MELYQLQEGAKKQGVCVMPTSVKVAQDLTRYAVLAADDGEILQVGLSLESAKRYAKRFNEVAEMLDKPGVNIVRIDWKIADD